MFKYVIFCNFFLISINPQYHLHRIGSSIINSIQFNSNNFIYPQGAIQGTRVVQGRAKEDNRVHMVYVILLYYNKYE